MMNQAIDILHMELTEDSNSWNYFYKFEAYTFTMNEAACTELYDIFMTRFKAGLKKFLDVDHKLHYALIIKRKEHPRYEGYEIHAGANDTKL